MKLQFENWSGWKIQAGFYRHPKSDRITLRIGRRAVSLLVDNTIDAIHVNGKSDSIELASVGAFGFVFGVAASVLL